MYTSFIDKAIVKIGEAQYYLGMAARVLPHEQERLDEIADGLSDYATVLDTIATEAFGR